MDNDIRTEHAFPSGDGGFGGGPNHDYGMTLRDWFAGQALAGGIRYGEQAYKIADDMLKERAKR